MEPSAYSVPVLVEPESDTLVKWELQPAEPSGLDPDDVLIPLGTPPWLWDVPLKVWECVLSEMP